MGYVGININHSIKRMFIDLMQEAGVRYVSLEELCIQLSALLVSIEKDAMTDGPTKLDYLFWTDAHNDALALLPKEARKEFVIAECIAYEQARLSSREHLV